MNSGASVQAPVRLSPEHAALVTAPLLIRTPGDGAGGEGVKWEPCDEGETITERSEDTHSLKSGRMLQRMTGGGWETGEECSLLSKGSTEPYLATPFTLMILWSLVKQWVVISLGCLNIVLIHSRYLNNRFCHISSSALKSRR